VEELQEIYHASMLALLTPWREIGELKSTDESFANVFARFVFTTDDWVKDIMANIQYQHKCSDGARGKRDEERRQEGTIDIDGHNTQGVAEPSTQTIRNENLVDNREPDPQFDQDNVEHQIASEYSQDDKLFAEVAMNIAFDAGIFEEADASDIPWDDIASPATHKQKLHFQMLHTLVQAVTKSRTDTDAHHEIEIETIVAQRHYPTSDVESNSYDSEDDGETDDNFDYLNQLNNDQRRAHDIVINHLSAHLNGSRPRQQLMIITGQGGTGKSTLLTAITTSFERLDCSQLLKKTAMSGVAASLIGGTTLH
jgi:hypothetical protein